MEPSQNIQLSRDSLANLLLDLEKKESSVDLAITSSLGEASLRIRSGKLAEARFGDLEGLAAARTLLAIREGGCTIENADDRLPEELGASLSELIQGASPSGVPRDLASAKSSSTLSMGSRIALTDSTPPKVEHKKTLQSRVPSQSRMPAIDGLSDSRSFDAPRSWSDSLQAKHPFATTVTGLPHKPVPARLMRQDHLTKGRTGYSSRPPPALAEEHVPLPKSLRRVDALPKIEGITTHRVTPLVDPPTTSKGMANALGAATVLPSDSLRRTSLFIGNIASDLPPDSPSTGLAERLPPVRAPQHSIYDEEVVDAAEGQLSDSEMPLPSTRLSIEALTQLQILNEAVSSRRGGVPFREEDPAGYDRPSSSAPQAASFELASRPSWDLPVENLKKTIGTAMRSSVPPSFIAESAVAPSSAQQGYTGTQSFTQQPGSVPDPSMLPGTEEEKQAGGNLPRVGRYEVLSRLKRGGMGSVYMCRLSTAAGFRRLFAMKVLHGHLAKQEGAVDAFFHEARVLGGLHHRNIVGIADVGSPEQPYIVLDYVEGGSLAEIYRATRKKPRDPKMIVSVLLDALSGLQAAHGAVDEHGRSLKLVHCDVTPHNLLVGIDGTARLTDFGIARTGSIDPQHEVTQGKPGYLAPERILKQPSDHRSDIFSIGVILYFGLSGVEPFMGATSEETMRNVLKKQVSPPSLAGFRPAPHFDLICMKALARDPSERFQTAEEMAMQLRQVAEREGLLATSVEMAEWVAVSLRPTLKARRVASMRGAESPEERKRWATISPPAVTTDVAQRRNSSNPPNSAGEATGPLSDPPSSGGDYGDHTQVLDGRTTGGSRGRQIAVYVLLMAAVFAVVWALLRPESLAPYLQLTTTTEGPGEDEAPVPDATSSDVDQPHNPDKIVLPAISSSPSKSQP